MFLHLKDPAAQRGPHLSQVRQPPKPYFKKTQRHTGTMEPIGGQATQSVQVHRPAAVHALFLLAFNLASGAVLALAEAALDPLGAHMMAATAVERVNLHKRSRGMAQVAPVQALAGHYTHCCTRLVEGGVHTTT